MDLVWDNERPTVTANGMKSAGTLERVAKHASRQREEQLYPVLRMGVLEMQKQAQEAQEANTQRKMQGVMDWLDTLS